MVLKHENADYNKALIDVIFEAFSSGIEWLSRLSYKRRKDEADKLITWFENYYGGCDSEYRKQNVLKEQISGIKGKTQDFIDNIADGIRSYPNDKYKQIERIEVLLAHLNKKYRFEIDLKALDSLKYRDKNDRILKMLKYIHSKERTREQIAYELGISERTLSDDIRDLKDGFDFLGTTIKIEQTDGRDNTFGSKVHPIFLAMHMSEIYSLTVGIKLLSRGTVFEDDLNRIADQIYMQLSGYAKEVVNGHSSISNVGFNGQKGYFRNSNKIMEEEMKPFTYFLKEPTKRKCEVTYIENEVEKKLIGTLHLPEDAVDGFGKVLVNSEDMEFKIDIEDIIEIGKAE